jgi:nitrate reductase NapD
MSEQNENLNGNWYVASLVLQVRAEFMGSVKATLTAMPQTEIHGEKADEGKIVVLIEAERERDLVERMESLPKIEGVMAVSLIYSQRDEPSL